MKSIAIYLAGAIRDGKEWDWRWRKNAALLLEQSVEGIVVLSPMAGKRYFPMTKSWDCCRIPPSAQMIVKQDFAMIDRADIILANFDAMADGYGCVGTLVELGYAVAKGKLIYSVWPRNLQAANAIYNIHPLVEENSAYVFPTVEEAVEYLRSYLNVTTGADNHFRGSANEGIEDCSRRGYTLSLPR
jgi:nucleoside 2-deoxyribosyltransferase